MEEDILFSITTNHKKDPTPKRVGFFYAAKKAESLMPKTKSRSIVTSAFAIRSQF